MIPSGPVRGLEGQYTIERALAGIGMSRACLAAARPCRRQRYLSGECMRSLALLMALLLSSVTAGTARGKVVPKPVTNDVPLPPVEALDGDSRA